MPNRNPRRLPPAAMDPQVIIGTNTRRSDMMASMERAGEDPEMLDVGINLALFFVYDYLPAPPASPAVTLALSGTLWVPDGVDRISRLPDALLSDIVSRLPVKDAARTAALASRWPHVWRSAALTLVDTHLFPDSGPKGPYIVGSPSPLAVTAAVSRVLAAHPGPFRCVHLTCTNMDEHRGEMARWLDILVAKGVEELIFINHPWPLDLRLPATIFSCASLTRLYLGIWRLPDTAAVPRGAAFPNLRELGLCFNVMHDRDLAFMLQRSPVLDILVITGSQTKLRLRLISHSLRCVQLGFCRLEDIEVVDAPRLERLFQREIVPAVNKRRSPRINNSRSSRIKIGHAPNLRLLGYLEPREQDMEISNTVIMAGTKENVVPSVQILAVELQFAVRNAVIKLPGFLRCFPNLDTLHVHSKIAEESSGKISLKFWQDRGPIKCIVQTMKKVFFYEFQGLKSEVAFLKFIAEQAQVLEKMVVVVASECLSSGDDVNVKLKPLKNAKWNSKACKLELFKSPLTEVASPLFSHKRASDFSFPDPFDLIYYQESL